MAISRTKTRTRKTLSSKESDFASHRPIARKPNMICVTGEEAGGWQISPNTVSLFFFIYIGTIIILHMVVKDKIPYGVPKHMLSHL